MTRRLRRPAKACSERSARKVGLDYLSGRNRTVAQVRRHLRKAAFEPEDVEVAIADLMRLKLLDDEQYARQWLEARLREKRPAGRRKFALDLRRKGVDPGRIDTVMDEYRERLESGEVVADLLRRQQWRYRGLDQVTARRRMLGYLSRRGYDRETADSAVQQVWEEIQDNDVAGD
mgnify:CR=1 FL=1